jgi:hypothetical protein
MAEGFENSNYKSDALPTELRLDAHSKTTRSRHKQCSERLPGMDAQNRSCRKTNVPFYRASGETDIALHNGQKDLALFNLVWR